MRNTSVIVRLFSIILLCWLAACAGETPTPTPTTPLRVGWTYREGDYTILIAKQMGFFANHNVEVEPVWYPTSTQAVPDMAGAKIDGGLLTMGELILASSLINIKGVMVYDSGSAYSVVAAPTINSILDLRNKRIGLNLHTSSEMFVSYMLASASLSPQNVQYVEMSPEEVVRNIPDQIDAGLVWEPYTSIALARGNKLLYTSSRYSSLIPGIIAFPQAVVSQRTEDIHAFVQAWNEATNYRLAHPQESLAIIMQETGLAEDQLGITGSDTLYTLEDNLKLFSSPATEKSSIYYIAQFNLNFLIQIGDITTPPDLQVLLDSSFLQ